MKDFTDKMIDLYKLQRFAFLVTSVAGAFGAVVSLFDPKMYWFVLVCLAMAALGAWGVRASTKVLNAMSEILNHPRNGA